MDASADLFGSLLPDVRVSPPGEASRSMATRLRVVECRDVTYVDGGWPVFWEEARGANVRDADGNVFLDVTAAFGVALLGHGHPTVTTAIERQAQRLIHGMGDIHPPGIKLELLERLATLSPWVETRTILGSSGSESVEAALKTAHVATGKAGILAFEGSYHGLTLGSLATTDREHFRGKFERRLYSGVAFAPYPYPFRQGEGAADQSLNRVRELLRRGAPNGDAIGVIVIEPVQGRGGARVPPSGYMSALSDLAAEQGVLIVADEIFTGTGRCGGMLASPIVGLRPDMVCLGKALGGGMPLSACLGRAEVMDAWPESTGEAIHTSTFLGHPLSCAAALAALDVFEADGIGARVLKAGARLTEMLQARIGDHAGVGDIRGLGLLLGVELVNADGSPCSGAGGRLARRLLSEGVIVLPAGALGHVLELTPSAYFSEAQLEFTVEALGRAVGAGV